MNPLKEKIFPQFISRILVLFICVSVSTTYSAAQKMVDFNNLTTKQDLLTDAPQAAPTPVVISGNPSCATLNANNGAFPSIMSDFGFKLEGSNRLMSGTFRFTNTDGELTGGAPSDPNNSVTTNVTRSENEPKTFTFSTTKSISAVIVKSGNESNVYVYDPATATSMGSLVTPDGQAISHIEFCYNLTSVTVIKEVSTTGGGTSSTVTFPFTVSGQFTDNFSLVDNNTVGPDRKIYSDITKFGSDNQITVTENPFGTGFQLNDIVCTGGTTTATLNPATNGGSVNITVKPGDSVRCIFKNGTAVITAAGADIAGRILSDNGRPISRAIVTVFNTNTLETRSVITNRYGYFGFQEMRVGDFYLISVASKGYWFAANNQGIGLTENLTNLEFVGIPFNNPVFGTSIFNDVIKSKGKKP